MSNSGMKIAIYAVGLPTGQRNADGTECIVLLDVKLTKLAADKFVEDHPGTVVQKWNLRKHS